MTSTPHGPSTVKAETMPSQPSPRMGKLQSNGQIDILSSGEDDEDIEIDILESPRQGALQTSAGRSLHVTPACCAVTRLPFQTRHAWCWGLPYDTGPSYVGVCFRNQQAQQKQYAGPAFADWTQSPVEPNQVLPVIAVRGPAEVLGHQAVQGHKRTPPQMLTMPTGLPHHADGQPQPQAAQKLFDAAASTTSCLHPQGVPTHPIRKLSAGTVYVTTGHHHSQQNVPPQVTSAQPLLQPAHSLAADSSGQAGATAAAARSEQQGSQLTETAHKAQPVLHASMQRPAVSEACPAQPSQHQQHRVQTPTAQQTGQHLLREQSTQPPQHQQTTLELRQQLQIPQASGRDAGSAAPGLSQQQEQQRPHAQANGHGEGMAEAEQESWSSTDNDDDFADWEQHILASAVPEPAGAGTEQQSAGESGLRAAWKFPMLTSEMSAKN